jgi:type IV pilus biogenesis protein CpaD/CtpE
MLNSTYYNARLIRPLLGISICLTSLGLLVRPSYAERAIPIQLNNSHWILLQQQDKKPDGLRPTGGHRQMQFTKTESLLPIVDQATFSKLSSEPSSETLQTVAKSSTWRLQLVTVHESALQPGYIDASAEVDCGAKQLRIIDQTAVPYKNIKSPEDELTQAINRQFKIVYRLLKNRPIATIAASKGDPWQPLATSDPVYQFVCAKSEFPVVNAGGSLPQHLFAYVWRNIWQDGIFPQMAPRPGINPRLAAYLETLREATRLEGRALGVAGVPSQIYQGFEQAQQPGKTSRSEIDQLLHESTPAGRIYATMLLVKLDPKAGRKLLEQMRSDQTPLTEASGCEVSPTTVGAAVDDILQGRSTVFPPLP